MRPNDNRVVLVGTVTWSKMYDFGDKAYTTLSLRIQAGPWGTFVDVSVNAADMERAENQALINTITSQKGIGVMLVGSMVEKHGKNDTVTIAVKANLSGLGIVENYSNEQVNSLELSGYVEGEGKDFHVRTPYVSVKEKKTLYRVIPVHTEGSYRATKGDIVYVSGVLNSKKAKIGEKEVDQLFAEADFILKIKSQERPYSAPRTNALASRAAQHTEDTSFI